MSQASKLASIKAKTTKRVALKDVPQFFRMTVEVDDLEKAISFYTALLDLQGRKQAGSRCYFGCGPATICVLDVSSARTPQPVPKARYFTVQNLEAVFDRAKALKCLAVEDVHRGQGGGIVVRPWGERSFYVEDPWKNALCFVEEDTVYTGSD